MTQLRDHGCVGIGAMTFAHARRGGRGNTLDVDEVLDSDGNAMEGTAVATGRQLTVRFRRLTPGGLRESHAHDVTITVESPNYSGFDGAV